MNLLSQYLSYQAPSSPGLSANVDHLRELLYQLTYVNLISNGQNGSAKVQTTSLPALLPGLFQQSNKAEGGSLPSFVDSTDALYHISRKVFVGGLPQDICKSTLLKKFSTYGQVRLDFPSEPTHPPRTKKVDRKLSTSGYVFLIYETEDAVFNLLRDCILIEGNYFLLFCQDSNMKYAQVRPWELSSITYIPNIDATVDPRLAIFIGGVPRPLTSNELAALLEENYGPLVYCEIDVDPDLFYPKGAARAVFASYTGYIKAIRSRFLHIPNVEFNKRTVEIKPYIIDETLCDECLNATSEHFCRMCMQYYCEACYRRMEHVSEIHSDQKPQTEKQK